MQKRFTLTVVVSTLAAALYAAPVLAIGPGDHGNSGNHGPSDHASPNAFMGSLNASVANEHGLEHAAGNSVVGELRQYRDSLQKASTDYAMLQCYLTGDGSGSCSGISPDPSCASQACMDAQTAYNQDLLNAQSAIGSAANKPITPEVVDAVNKNLGVSQ